MKNTQVFFKSFRMNFEKFLTLCNKLYKIYTTVDECCKSQSHFQLYFTFGVNGQMMKF